MPGWVTFTEALGPTRDAVAADRSGAAWGTRFFVNASNRVLEKAGFVYDGEVREGGELVWRFSHARPWPGAATDEFPGAPPSYRR